MSKFTIQQTVKKVAICFHVDKELFEKLDSLSQKHKTTKVEIVRQMIRHCLSEMKNE